MMAKENLKLNQQHTQIANKTQQQLQQNFTNIYAAPTCECLRTRNMCKAQMEHKDKQENQQNCRVRKRRKHKTSNMSLALCKTTSHPAFYYYSASTTLALYSNLLQHLVGSLVWHVTASTAISIFATLYYFIANTQGASAVLAVTTASLPASSLSASLAVNSPLATTTSSLSSSAASTNLSFYPANSTTANISINNIYSSSFLDLNYNINSTEITILNGVSSLPTTKVSGFSNDNNSNSSNYNNINNNYNNVITVYYNNAIGLNDTLDDMSAEDASEYIFDRTDVRIIFITLYTMVFCCCFFGNLLVILVVTLSRRLRSITNFFLANLALADFCVGLFCVMQNLSIYLIDSWVFGEFLCRMYQFVHSLSYTASIFILVVICMERYFAIVHPITCKQILTAARLRMVILTVWITSAVYSTPKFVFSKTIKNVHTESGREEEICVLDRKMFNSKLLDMINFGLLYCIPLLVMTVLYSKIAIALWRSSRGLQHHLAQQENGMGMHNSMYHHHHNHNHNNQHNHLHNHHQQLSQQQQQQQPPPALTAPLGTPISVNSSVVSGSTLSRKQSCKYDGKRGVNISESQHDSYKVSLDADRPVVSTCRKTSFYQHSHNHLTHQQQPQPAASANHHHRPHAQHHGLHGSQRVSHISHSSNNVLRARRGVVRMLIIFVLTFALCNLPYHARKMWQYWSRSYRGDSNFNALFTPLTFLVTYFNSGINPLLYAFLSRNFRKGMRELLMCSWRKSKTKSSTNSSMHHKRMTLQTHSLPTDTTHIGNEQL
ncbi:trissin receptor [Calliphora vicina]|uniref:trissin receptor n=1 Tax=Calliphora vicina TaxID=7373 RepID=UPI00325ACC1C